MLKNQKKKSVVRALSDQSTTPPINSTKFTDTLGREWDCKINLAGASRVDASDFTELGIEEFSILSPNKQTLSLLLTDKRLMFAVIWAIVYPQASGYDSFKADPKKDPEEAQMEFMEAIGRPEIEEATQAITEALSSFFPEIRNVLSALLKRISDAQARLSQEMEKLIPLLDKAIDEELDKRLAEVEKRKNQFLAGKPGIESGT